MSYRNYRDLENLRRMENEMQRIAEETLRGFLTDVSVPGRFWQPRVDVHETENDIVVRMEAAGVKPDKLNVSLSSDDRYLNIQGERYEDEDDRTERIRCYQLEIYYGPFERQIALPADTFINREAITANYKDGFLVVTLPKRTAPVPESRSIPVTD